MSKNRTLAPGLGVLLVCLLLAACHTAQVTHNGDVIHMTVWAVPETAATAKIQVRLAPQEPIPSAELEIVGAEAALDVTPEHFVLTDLKPPSTVGGKTHNPPALGMTLIRSFTVRSTQPGQYPLTIRLRYGDHVETRSLTLNFSKH